MSRRGFTDGSMTDTRLAGLASVRSRRETGPRRSGYVEDSHEPPHLVPALRPHRSGRPRRTRVRSRRRGVRRRRTVGRGAGGRASWRARGGRRASPRWRADMLDDPEPDLAHARRLADRRASAQGQRAGAGAARTARGAARRLLGRDPQPRRGAGRARAGARARRCRRAGASRKGADLVRDGVAAWQSGRRDTAINRAHHRARQRAARPRPRAHAAQHRARGTDARRVATLVGCRFPTPSAPSIRALLAPDAVIAEPEQLRTYECDALTGHRAMPELVVLPGTAAARAGGRAAVPRAPRAVRRARRRHRALGRRAAGRGRGRDLARAAEPRSSRSTSSTRASSSSRA